VDLSLIASLPQGVTVSSQNGELAVHLSRMRFVLRELPVAVQETLKRLVYPGQSIGQLAACIEQSSTPYGGAHLFFCLQQLAARSGLCFSADADGRRWASLVPTASTFVLKRSLPGACAYVLSRFAYLRRLGNHVVLESPLTAARIVFHDPQAAQLACALATPATAAQVAERTVGLSHDAIRQLLNLLLAGGMMAEASRHGVSAEDEHASRQGWDLHDLLFHARSRAGRCDGALGNWYPLAGRSVPLPAVKPVVSAASIPLHRPAMESLMASDPPLAEVMEARRSIRQYGATCMTVRELGEFLFRVARVKEVRTVDHYTPYGHVPIELSSRPYPTGGSLCELEVYPVVQACAGLEPGLYHYDPLGHQLARVAGQTAEWERLLDGAAAAIGSSRSHLQVLLILTARFHRVFWKYSSLGYALILKDVGVVFQNMYLAATAMGLAPCALGSGDSDLCAKAIGSDYYAETSVGEFTLGSKP
jgi:oxazoline/thiazoline dehydrogenase